MARTKAAIAAATAAATPASATVVPVAVVDAVVEIEKKTKMTKTARLEKAVMEAYAKLSEDTPDVKKALAILGKFAKKTEGGEKRKGSAYNEFVKQHMAEVREELKSEAADGVFSHKDCMSRMAVKWNQYKLENNIVSKAAEKAAAKAASDAEEKPTKAAKEPKTAKAAKEPKAVKAAKEPTPKKEVAKVVEDSEIEDSEDEEEEVEVEDSDEEEADDE